MEATAILNSLGNAGYEERHQALRKTLNSYRQLRDGDSGKAIIDQAMASYRTMCEQSGDDAKIRRCNVLTHKYINQQKLSNRALASKYYVHLRTVSRDTDQGIADLMVFVYGVDGIRWV